MAKFRRRYWGDVMMQLICTIAFIWLALSVVTATIFHFCLGSRRAAKRRLYS
jgi:hypothetical protein